ncbi:MAG: hypothetical protein KJO69_07990 [Gammaproteobacteria bacterium]|nr:hypothetical protein [Gammaproteobacteria bacterium]
MQDKHIELATELRRALPDAFIQAEFDAVVAAFNERIEELEAKDKKWQTSVESLERQLEEDMQIIKYQKQQLDAVFSTLRPHIIDLCGVVEVLKDYRAFDDTRKEVKQAIVELTSCLPPKEQSDDND